MQTSVRLPFYDGTAAAKKLVDDGFSQGFATVLKKVVATPRETKQDINKLMAFCGKSGVDIKSNVSQLADVWAKQKVAKNIKHHDIVKEVKGLGRVEKIEGRWIEEISCLLRQDANDCIGLAEGISQFIPCWSQTVGARLAGGYMCLDNRGLDICLHMAVCSRHYVHT